MGVNTQSPTTEAMVLRRELRFRVPLTHEYMQDLLDKALEAARAEGRREAVRALHYRGTGVWPSEAGVQATLNGIAEVAALNASESPPTRTCVEPGCKEVAGTPWTDHWCHHHDKERRDRISANLDAMVGDASESVQPPETGR